MIRCRITLKFGPSCPGIKLTGLFASTCDAVVEALTVYPAAVRVSVITMKGTP